MPNSLDIWIAEHGAASQLFMLDTQVSTPLITGDHIVPEPGLNETFGLANLDHDVVDIVVGPSASGVVAVHNFFNNQDGTGSFQADFDPASPTRSLAVIAIDDVANRSNETPIFVVQSQEAAKLGETFSIRPQASVSSSMCQDLLDGMPPSFFILKRTYTIPYSFNTSIFELRAITPGAPVDIAVVRRDLAGKSDETQHYVVVPNQPTIEVKLRMGRGNNVVTAMDSEGRSDTIIVSATTYAAVLCSYAREIYNYSQVKIDEQSEAIYSPVSTRLAEPLLTFPNLLPDVKSQQTLATKLAIRAMVGSPGKQSGVRDLLTALTLSTPIFVDENPNAELFEPAVRPLYNSQESLAGVEAHVWPANQCIRKWLAFIQYINNLDVFQLISISENEVVFRDENGDLRRHQFDFGKEECSLTTLALQSICFENIDVRLTIFSESDMRICAATYPLDLRPTDDYPIRPLDHETEIDPGFDGYVDFSVTGHWDSGTELDSQGSMPALGSGADPCVHDGYLVSPLLMAGDAATIENQVELSSFFCTSQPGRSVNLDVNILARQVVAGMSMVVDRYEVHKTAGCNMQILAQIPKIAHLDIVISS